MENPRESWPWRKLPIGADQSRASARNHPHESWPHSGVSRQRELAWVRRILILYVGDYEPTLKGPLPVGVVMHRTTTIQIMTTLGRHYSRQTVLARADKCGAAST